MSASWPATQDAPLTDSDTTEQKASGCESSSVEESIEDDVPAEEFAKLDPRAVGLWRLSNLIGNAIFGTVLAAGGIGLLFAVDFPYSLLIPLTWWLFASC